MAIYFYRLSGGVTVRLTTRPIEPQIISSELTDFGDCACSSGSVPGDTVALFGIRDSNAANGSDTITMEINRPDLSRRNTGRIEEDQNAR